MPKVLVLYHYLHPDDVVSAVHFSDLCLGLVQRGWDVRAMPSNRSCRQGAQAYSARENWKDVQIERLWRPDFSQANGRGRLLNALWMFLRWNLAAFTEQPDVVIVGTDPVLSVAVAGVWKILRPRIRVAHWCFDLYPEAAFADGMLDSRGWFAYLAKPILRWSYKACDLVVDIGPCMRQKLRLYESPGRHVTLTPWALAEPPETTAVDRRERSTIFGDAALALLYSGSFGRAHSSDLVLELARRLENTGTRIAFSVRGNRVKELQHDAAPYPNVRFVPFAEAGNLEARLSAPDIHVVSLREEWTGTVVPSKFFGALAVGRPVLFTGSFDSSIAHWIREHKVGWVLTPSTMDEICEELRGYCQDPKRLAGLFEHCHDVYTRCFSKASVLDQWGTELRGVLPNAY